MISTFTAFIDANVLYGARLRSLVLFVAQTKLYRAKWSERVNDEWVDRVKETTKLFSQESGLFHSETEKCPVIS
jgi:hypothetical protein